jgi:hypothetical protein
MKVDGGPASLQDLMYPVRPTAIGRSMGSAADASALAIPSDLARGTMLGHSIHLADGTPQEAAIELSSGAVQFVEGTAPSQPFALADRLVVALPAPTAPAQRFHTPYDTDPRTDAVGRPRSKVARVIALMGGLAVVAAGWYGWTQLRNKPTGSSPPPAESTAATPANPAVAPAIVPIPEPAAPAALPAEPPAPPPRPVLTMPPTTARADEPKTMPAAAAAGERKTTRHAPMAPERRPARIAAPSDATAPPATRKPVRSRHRDAVPADPDATLPPSI